MRIIKEYCFWSIPRVPHYITTVIGWLMNFQSMCSITKQTTAIAAAIHNKMSSLFTNRDLNTQHQPTRTPVIQWQWCSDKTDASISNVNRVTVVRLRFYWNINGNVCSRDKQHRQKRGKNLIRMGRKRFKPVNLLHIQCFCSTIASCLFLGFPFFLALFFRTRRDFLRIRFLWSSFFRVFFPFRLRIVWQLLPAPILSPFRFFALQSASNELLSLVYISIANENQRKKMLKLAAPGVRTLEICIGFVWALQSKRKQKKLNESSRKKLSKNKMQGAK